MARNSHDIHGGNCVAYAREVTGVHLDGNAAAWWPHAEGRYERGQKPEPGAILVFKPFGRMHVGHVAVVSRIVNAREVLVDQANWVRGRITTAMSVIDVSAANDWTSVKVQYQGTHGRDNPTYGFIYPRELSHGPSQAVADAQEKRPAHGDRLSARAKHHKDADEQEVATAEPKPERVAEHVKHHKNADPQDAAAAKSDAPRQVAERTAHHKDHGARAEAKAEAKAYAAMKSVPPKSADQLADNAPAHHKHHKADDARYALY
jgi:surface antigen